MNLRQSRNAQAYQGVHDASLPFPIAPQHVAHHQPQLLGDALIRKVSMRHAEARGWHDGALFTLWYSKKDAPVSRVARTIIHGAKSAILTSVQARTRGLTPSAGGHDDTVVPRWHAPYEEQNKR